ncbi:MAG TPA: 2-hydroxymuconate tautomerase [Caulobacteraceae bacterium]|jgi:4-oxalocrotonate tautomerase|nr:2-hydroxymuconate tautomerase [Caulobacteraceae bacterium]
MPEVIIYAVAGRTPEQKKALCQDITEAVHKHFAAPREAVTIQIVEAARDSKSKGGRMFSEM